MKKILIDATALSDQYKTRGIGTYARKIIEYVTSDRSIDWHLLTFSDIDDAIAASVHNLGHIRLSSPRNIFFFRRTMLPIIKKINPDLYFAPHFERGLPVKNYSTAVVLHDLFPLMHHSYSARNSFFNSLKGMFYRYNLSRSKNADLVITHANFTKIQLAKIGFDEKKVRVIYLGPGLEYNSFGEKSVAEKKQIEEKYDLSDSFIMYYGGLEKNKNVDKLITAFANASKQNELKLLISDKALYFDGDEIVAEHENAKRIRDLIISMNLSKRVILPRFIESEDMITVFEKAFCFVHLSGYEGFGFSVVEAMYSGCPVIAANSSCYPEIVGDAAILVDPYDTDEVATKILGFVTNSKRRRDAIKRGQKRAKNFSWEKTGKETLDAFKSIIS